MPKAISIDQVEKKGEPVVDKRSEPKTLEVVHELDGGLYYIKWTAGGEVPAELSGKYTSLHRASAAIESFLRTKEQTAG